MTSCSAAFVLMASEPPLSITAFPDLRQRQDIWTRASGLDSNTTPMTPMGQDTFSSMRPSSSSVRERTRPVTSSCSAIERTDLAEASRAVSSNFSLLRSGLGSEARLAASRSWRLASVMAARPASMASAIA